MLKVMVHVQWDYHHGDVRWVQQGLVDGTDVPEAISMSNMHPSIDSIDQM